MRFTDKKPLKSDIVITPKTLIIIVFIIFLVFSAIKYYFGDNTSSFENGSDNDIKKLQNLAFSMIDHHEGEQGDSSILIFKKPFEDRVELGRAFINWTGNDDPEKKRISEKYGHISNWDVSKVTDMSYMFYQSKLFNENISRWDTSKVTDMSYMFYKANAFNQDISNWDTSNVTIMYAMFENANAFNRDISNWDVSKVTDMSNMFYEAHAFNRDISRWNFSSVTNMNMNNMFDEATAFIDGENSTKFCNRLITNYSTIDKSKLGFSCCFSGVKVGDIIEETWYGSNGNSDKIDYTFQRDSNNKPVLTATNKYKLFETPLSDIWTLVSPSDDLSITYTLSGSCLLEGTHTYHDTIVNTRGTSTFRLKQ